MDKLHVHSVLCNGCNNQSWLWYCKNGHDISVFGEMSCQDYIQHGVEEAKIVEQPHVAGLTGQTL